MGDNRLTRRGFLSTSATGLMATGLLGLSSRLVNSQEPSKKDDKKEDILHRTLGKTGLNIPIVSMGVMNSNNPEIVQASYEIGIRHFDTAATYQYGRNEQMVGEVIKRLGVRDKVVIGTKELGPAERSEMTPEQIKKRLINLCEGSLRRLKTDYIDILYIHGVAGKEDVDKPEIVDGFATLKKQGKIRFSGVTTHESMAEVINAVAEKMSYDVVLPAFNVTMADDIELLNAIEKAAAAGIGIIAMKTQAGGQRLASEEASRRFSKSTIMKASLKWVLNNKSISTAIPGFDNFENMREDFSVAEGIEYTLDEKEFLSGNKIKLSMGFCRQCRQCRPTCPGDVDIPALMRVHMYAASYGNLVHARATLDDIPENRSIRTCASCRECAARCARGVDIDRRISELKAMYV